MHRYSLIIVTTIASALFWQNTRCASFGANLPSEVPCSLSSNKIVLPHDTSSDIFVRLYDDQHREVGSEFLPSPRRNADLLYSQIDGVTPARSASCRIAPKDAVDTPGISACDNVDRPLMAVDEGLDVRVREVAYTHDFLIVDASAQYIGYISGIKELDRISLIAATIDHRRSSYYPRLPSQNDVHMALGPLSRTHHMIYFGDGGETFAPPPGQPAPTDGSARGEFSIPTSVLCVN
jgi:hypothetical protein